MVGQTVSLVETNALSPFGQSQGTRSKVRMYNEWMERAKNALSDPTMGFVFLHAPVPHAPHPYNRFTGRFDERNNPLQGYVDSLALMDRMLSELRVEMEKNGAWARTTLLLSADHPFRAAQGIDGKFDIRVPFMLKLPGQTTAAAFDTPFNTIVAANLLLSIMHGEVSTVPDVVSWLERHHQDTEASVELP